MKLAILASTALLAALTSAGGAWAGESACWYEQGVIVAPASIAGLAGDYILDTGTPVTQLHETKAQGAGIAESALHGRVQIAGLTLIDRPFKVVDLDARTGAFPTPIAGVIGADLLSGYVVDISFAPCTVAIYPLRKAPAFKAKASLPLVRGAGVALARAAVSDGPHALGGDFVIATGADTAVRVDARLASVPGAAKPQDVLPYAEGRAKLRAASFAGVLLENLDGGLVMDGPAAAGVIGAPLLARWRLRFDFPRGRLLLRPAGG
ncbi:MAG: hypothetical protein V4514_15685 [Pseudomonadota bacterium]|uniref:hypothetical protein n=1 Tax=unclassified Phenylobacterium TaxID=2640670 RepID=UPI000700514A|nr:MULTISPECIES: hypothetical protein [unclassified Phenylobacterium]KRB52113.1 hypothetical protein ASE02_13320 [Phenylobacterium sp. Root700]MBT9471272.1 hypothetical protein [Phenylobacterium sp.]